MVFDETGEAVCQVYGITLHHKLSDLGERDAKGLENAHLIAAAPLLLEALEALASIAHTEVRCGGKRGGCLLCGRLVECDCKLGPAIDKAVEALISSQGEPKDA